jgi:threonine dehydratase
MAISGTLTASAPTMAANQRGWARHARSAGGGAGTGAGVMAAHSRSAAGAALPHHGVEMATAARLPVEPADVAAAAVLLAGRVLRTPLLPLDGTELLVKCESLQQTGSFKLRGATNAVTVLRPRGVVTASSGNHGRALAAAARHAGIPATVVMTADSTPFKRATVERAGATVVDCPPGTEERTRVAEAIARERGLTLVPAYDHPLVIAGQGTVGLEILADVPEVDEVVVPLGGGGLLSGIATALGGGGRRPRLIGVEPQAGDDFVRSRAAGHRVTVPVPSTICDGARVQTPGRLTFDIVQARVDELLSVDDDAVLDALRVLANGGIYAEPTGALAVAGALQRGLRGRTVCVVSGRNVDPAEYARLLRG